MLIEPIARFHSPFPTKFGIPRQAGLADSLEGEIVFEPAYRNPDAVRGLEGFDYLWIIWEFSANRNEEDGETAFQPTVRPPRLGGNERIGVFASRSPFRPNSLGLSSVKIASIDPDARDSQGRSLGPVIHVLGADLMDGTPIYDIKPYVTYADSHPEARSGFVDSREWKPLEVVLPDGTDEMGINSEALKQILSQDPRPQYKKDSEKTYGMLFGSFDVSFKVEDGLLTVTQIRKAR